MKLHDRNYLIVKISYGHNKTVLILDIYALSLIRDFYIKTMKFEILTFYDFRYEWTDKFEIFNSFEQGNLSIYQKKGKNEFNIYHKKNNIFNFDLVYYLPGYLFEGCKFNTFSLMLDKYLNHVSTYIKIKCDDKFYSLEYAIKHKLFNKKIDFYFVDTREEEEFKINGIFFDNNLFSSLKSYIDKELYIIDDLDIRFQLNSNKLFYSFVLCDQDQSKFLFTLFPDKNIPLKFQKFFHIRERLKLKDLNNEIFSNVRKIDFKFSKKLDNTSTLWEIDIKNKHNLITLNGDYFTKINKKGTLK